MRLMEEAASGMPLSDSAAEAGPRDAVAGAPSPTRPPTLADMRSNNFLIDDDEGDEGEGPPSVFAAANLWTRNSATNLKLDDEKMGFIAGSEDKERSESRDLLQRAAKRLSRDNRAVHADSEGDDFHQRSGLSLPTCCLLHRRAIAATLMIATLLVVLIAIVAPGAKNSRANEGGAVPPWAHPPKGPLGSVSGYLNEQQREKFDRIKDRILEHGVSHASTLEDESSSQYKALTWLVRDDERQLDVMPLDDEGAQFSAGDVDRERALFNRYALAVLWFQTTDLRIVEQSMTASNIEDPFDNAVDPLEFTQEDVAWHRSQNWMTGRGLCLWQGVTCHPKEEDGDEKYDGDFYVSILNLTDNNVKGVVPREVYTGFEKLKALDLSRNGMKGTIGRELGMLKDLEDLFLFENDFSGTIPDEIGYKLRNLYNLYINDNRFRGTLPPSIGDLTKLRGASLFKNRLEGRIPDSLGNLKAIIALYLDSNKFTGHVPASIGSMASMIDLRLRDNDLSGTIPAELGNLDNLETLYLDSNAKIKGTIPAELSNLAKLTELHLYEMDLTGTLPSELGLLDGLVYLYLDTNQLKGTIPEEWGGMRDLEQLFLTGNDLSGRLPVSIRGLKSLEMLRAADNELSGPIPSDIGKLTKLEYIYLEGNNFSGNVPSELGELTKLKALHLHESSLVGEMPSEICKLQQEFVLQDLTADCEDIACSCCKCDS
ncbi:hypothetical protein ACHAXT_002750 [Thalassiosira profunda]